jgi:hypothetical protein
MTSKKTAAAEGGVLGVVKFVGRVIVFVLSFGMLCPNVFDPGGEDVASRQAKSDRDAKTESDAARKA